MVEVTWLVVADGGRARVFQMPGLTLDLPEVEELVNDEYTGTMLTEKDLIASGRLSNAYHRKNRCSPDRDSFIECKGGFRFRYANNAAILSIEKVAFLLDAAPLVQRQVLDAPGDSGLKYFRAHSALAHDCQPRTAARHDAPQVSSLRNPLERMLPISFNEVGCSN